MTSAIANKQLPLFQERITKVIAEVKGVRAQYGVNDWEWARLQEWQVKNLDWGSDKQNKILADIEKKVFSQQQDD